MTRMKTDLLPEPLFDYFAMQTFFGSRRRRRALCRCFISDQSAQ